MSNSRIGFYYKNVMANVIGEKHGIIQKHRKDLTRQTTPTTFMLNQELKEGKNPYRYLSFNIKICQKIQDLTAKYEEIFKYFIVLKIGGSVMVNIALQT
jgi:hypothetical protein